MRVPRFYGWVVIATASLVLAVSAGTRFSFGAVLPVMISDRGWTLGAVSGASALASIMIGLLQPLVGRLADRYGPRLVLTVGIAMVGLGTLATARIGETWQLYVTFGVLAGAGFGATLQLTGGVLATRWFSHSRGLAVAIVTSGVAVASFVIVPLAMWLLVRVGWSGYYLATGSIILVLIVPMTFLVIRDSPPGVGATMTGTGKKRPPRLPMATPLPAGVFWNLTFGMLV